MTEIHPNYISPKVYEPERVELQYRMSPILELNPDGIRAIFYCSGDKPNTVCPLLIVSTPYKVEGLKLVRTLQEAYEQFADNESVWLEVHRLFNCMLNAPSAFCIEGLYVYATERTQPVFAIPEIVELGTYPYSSSLRETYDRVMGTL